MTDLDWREHAGCRDVNPELFYADDRDRHAITEAKRVCGDCPVAAECLEGALLAGDRYGIWGGLTAAERSRLARVA